ncbi:MAG TPA: hypothetical protein VF491_20345 [Vicinamibacterales bacterium]
MIESDFPVLRESVHDSVMGRSVRWFVTAIGAAASEAAVTRYVSSIGAGFQGDAATRVRLGGVALAVAAIAAWGLSRFVPPYVATAIPDAVFVMVAVVSGIAASRADSVANQWRTSRVRRLKTW